ncbi:hypothetical protein BWQ96_09280 [Gracilariopsis chorda]|uniref:Uncharacterized protein n=1 Tax=Gracilariopsis chorda TaxID=448386 RepID=A0A2V3IFX1_9FLOR|nr:hypothetical protein BWQ96_09280 [Gracilariopsis chorda]|eukprot:PXF40985.1 hypothetical protein BWQ96_09280 [Gracilariopsis chorda]
MKDRKDDGGIAASAIVQNHKRNNPPCPTPPRRRARKSLLCHGISESDRTVTGGGITHCYADLKEVTFERKHTSSSHTSIQRCN